MTPRTTALAFAIGAAFAGGAAAQSTADLLKELEALKARVAELEAKQKSAADNPGADKAQWGMTPEQSQAFNRITVKTEALEDAQEANGYKNLKISGLLDPVFIYNQRQRTQGFVFLNNFASSTEVFAYDNSYFGMAVIDFQKELEGGTRWRLTLAPHKSVGSNYNFPSIVHEASLSIPISDLQTRFWAGQIPDWSGYEYYLSNQTKLVTHNMMFDFLAPTYYTAVGTDITRGKWQFKTAIGNMNASRYINNDSGRSIRTPIVTARVDYSKGEFNGWGSAVQAGRTFNAVTGGYSTLLNGEVDAYFIRGDLTWQGQFNAGRQKDAAFNGKDSSWWGLSTLAAYKLSPRFEVVGRADYLNNRRNGGGTFNITGFNTCGGTGLCGPDGRNGFGPGMTQDSTGAWVLGDPDRGANRYAISLGANYALTLNATAKVELRFDGADLPVFLNVSDGGYRKNNIVFGTSVAVSF